MNYNLYLTYLINDLNKSYNHSFSLRNDFDGEDYPEYKIVYNEFWINCLIICSKCNQNNIIHIPIYKKINELIKNYGQYFIPYDDHFYIIKTFSSPDFVLNILTCKEEIIKNIIE